MSGGDEQEAKSDDPSSPDSEPVRDSCVEVEPEVIPSARPAAVAEAKDKSHLPPPPPRLRPGASKEPRPLTVTGNPKLARDLMTRQLFTIGPEDALESLEQHMESFRFRHLPVVEGKKLVGLINWSDLLHASSSFLSDSAKQRDEIIHKLPALRIMRRDFTSVRPAEPLAEVAATMWNARAGCVLVTEEDSTLVGIITQGDFVRLAHHFLTQSN